MAKRPTSDLFPAGSGCVLSSYETRMEDEAEEEDRVPIISLSKSHMDVLMSAPSCKRDPTWARLDMRRSCSQGTATSPNTLSLQQLCGLKPHRVDSPNTVIPTYPKQPAQTRHSAVATDQWVASVDRRSVCSGSACSGGSSPDSVVWRGAPIHPLSGSEGAHLAQAPDSPMSRLASPPLTPSPFISPLHTPTLPSPNLLPSPLTVSQHPCYQNHLQMASHATLPLPPPTPSHMPAPPQQVPPDSPLPAQVSPPWVYSPKGLDIEGLEDCSPDRSVFGESPLELSPSFSPGGVRHLLVGTTTPVDSQVCVSKSHNDKIPQQFQFQSLWQPKQSCMASMNCSTHRPKLPLSLSDSQLDSCFCNHDPFKPELTTRMQMKAHSQGGGLVLKDEGTMTDQKELVDAAVQVVPSPGSWGSHSILGSPPGSRLNLRSSIGSHSNLVSPSSSMFCIESSVEEVEEEADLVWEVSTPPVTPTGRRRSCLKVQGEEGKRSGFRNLMGRRRSSMKQVQWDEDGMTWDVHGAALDPEELSTAIQRHLQLKTQDVKQNKVKKSSCSKAKSKKKTPVTTVPLSPDASGKAPNGSEDAPTRGKETVTFDTACESGNVQGEERKEPQTGKGKNGEVEEEEEVGENKKAEVEGKREEDGFAEDEEVYGEEAARERKASSFRDAAWNRKRGGRMMRSLRRPKWCVQSNSDE